MTKYGAFNKHILPFCLSVSLINHISNLKCNLGLANAENPIFGLHFSWICNYILIPNKTPTKLLKLLLKREPNEKWGKWEGNDY